METVRTRVNIFETWIDKIDMAEALRRIDGFVAARKPHQVVTANLDFLWLAAQDGSFREIINTSGLVVADGMPLVWGARLRGEPLPERIAGVDLVRECARLSAERGHRIFLLGAASGVAERAAAILREGYPSANIVGTHSPSSLRGDGERRTVALLRAARPDILFVALGAPHQERWIREHMGILDVPVCMGVGGAFDMLSGRISRAPRWMQRTGLEWFHRLLKEPDRLWKRYFINDLPLFLRLLTWSATATSTPPRPGRRRLLSRWPRATTHTGVALLSSAHYGTVNANASCITGERSPHMSVCTSTVASQNAGSAC